MLCTSINFQSYDGVIRKQTKLLLFGTYFKKDNKENGATFFTN